MTVRDGVLVRVSASSIESFDSSTTWGCERRWYFKEVLGLEEPMGPGLALGSAVHAVLESAAKREAGTFDARATAIAFPGLPFVEQFRAEGIEGIEHKFEHFIAGVPLLGYIDLLTSVRVQDWKTSSDPEKYGKTARELRESTQMLLYAWVTGKRVLSHVTLATKGKPRANLVEAKISEEGLASGLERIIVTVERMKEAAALKSVTDLPPDTTKCGRCPFTIRCPRGNTLMGILDAFVKKSTPAPAPVAAPAAQPVVPPDAHVSVATNPEASKPVVAEPTDSPEVKRRLQIRDMPTEEPEKAKVAEVTRVSAEVPAVADVNPTLAPKSKGGRPPGAKNKPKPLPEGALFAPAPVEVQKFEKVPAPRAAPTVTASTPVKVSTHELRVHTLRVTRGGTINLGNYNSARVELTMEAECAGDEVAAYRDLDARVNTLLKAELESMLPAASVEKVR